MHHQFTTSNQTKIRPIKSTRPIDFPVPGLISSRSREMKRSFEEEQQLQSLAVTKYLMSFLSQKLNSSSSSSPAAASTFPIRRRVFECKTCDRRFPSFQALGGHRASHHKRPKLMTTAANDQGETTTYIPLPAKPNKTHECSICGSEFPTGQALGGHMRRHRTTVVKDDTEFSFPKLPPVLMRSNSCSKRVMCMDLNLTPLENDLELMFGNKLAPKVCPI